MDFPIANSKWSHFLSPGLSGNSESEPESVCSWSGTFRNTIFQSNCFVFSFVRIQIALQQYRKGKQKELHILGCLLGGDCC